MVDSGSPPRGLARRNRRRCRGLAGMWVVAAGPAFLTMLCFVLEIGNIWLARGELETALESAALAAVKAWKETNSTALARDYAGSPHRFPLPSRHRRHLHLDLVQPGVDFLGFVQLPEPADLHDDGTRNRRGFTSGVPRLRRSRLPLLEDVGKRVALSCVRGSGRIDRGIARRHWRRVATERPTFRQDILPSTRTCGRGARPTEPVPVLLRPGPTERVPDPGPQIRPRPDLTDRQVSTRSRCLGSRLYGCPGPELFVPSTESGGEAIYNSTP